MKRKAKSRKLVCVLVAMIGAVTMMVSPSALAQEDPAYADDFVIAGGDVAYGLSNTEAGEGGVQPYSSGLISTYKILAYRNTSYTARMELTVTTESMETMKKIGIKTMYCQRLVNGVWTNYLTDKDLYSTNSKIHKDVRSFVVEVGYYYRIVVNHYAEKTVALIFTDSETVENISGSVDFRNYL